MSPEREDGVTKFLELLARAYGYKSVRQEPQRSQRVYLIDFPLGYERQCGGMVNTSGRFYMFGTTQSTPSYEGASRVFVEADREARHNLIVQVATFFASVVGQTCRLSVYTRDPVLRERALTLVNTCQFKHFKVYFIKRNISEPAVFPAADAAELTPADTSKLASVHGKWIGGWKRHGTHVQYQMEMDICQEGAAVSATGRINYTVRGRPTVVLEQFKGHLWRNTLLLWGVSTQYLDLGASRRYGRDGFILQLDEWRGATKLSGSSLTAASEGTATFERLSR